jgi:hypothetical protein
VHQFFKCIEQLNGYLETLPCLYYSPKANSVTKHVEPLDDSNLATYLLQMCPTEWQKQYDLNDHSTLLSTTSLLLVLENIKTNVKVDHKPASNYKAKGAKSKRKMASTVSWILKKAHKGLVQRAAEQLPRDPTMPVLQPQGQ